MSERESERVILGYLGSGACAQLLKVVEREVLEYAIRARQLDSGNTRLMMYGNDI